MSEINSGFMNFLLRQDSKLSDIFVFFKRRRLITVGHGQSFQICVTGPIRPVNYLEPGPTLLFFGDQGLIICWQLCLSLLNFLLGSHVCSFIFKLEFFDYNLVPEI